MPLHTDRHARRAPRKMAALRLIALIALVGGPAQAQSTRAEYLRWFDTDGDGRVSLSEYQEYMSHGFRAMDLDGDGVLHAGELPPSARVRTATTLQSHHRSLTRMFDRLDINHDGYLDADELTAMP